LKFWRRVTALAAAAVLCACATSSPLERAANDDDPWEGMNRLTFGFNDALDVSLLEPTATGWEWVTFEGLRLSIDKAVHNLRFPVRLVGNLAQGELRATGTETARFTINSTVGLLGFFDPARHWGIEKHEADFGQAMGVWGVPAGPYLMLPIFGPSSPRDTFGRAVDMVLSAGPGLINPIAGAAIFGVNLINGRALLLEPVREAKRASLDYYVFVRDVWTQRRRRMILGEQPEAETIDDDFYDIEDDE
jgi:phospholipid-binding lipoprotein MlaA